MSNDSVSDVNLAHRLDTLSVALRNLEENPQTERAARELVTLIRASSEFRHMNALAKAAEEAESGDSKEFQDRLRNLIALMKQEVSLQNIKMATVLIISRDKAFVTELKTILEIRGYPVVVAETPAEATSILATQSMGVCIVDLVLAKTDGRSFINNLRVHSETAGLLIVAIGPPLTSGEMERQSLGDADGFFKKPVNVLEIFNFLNLRLRRGPARGREARRDPTTGTPNRAACYEAYGQIQKACSDTDPISFALFGIHRFSTLVRNGGPVVRENLIRQVGSLLSASFRSSDVVARWGVSEFAVIMPGEDHFGATKAIEKVLPTLNSQAITTSSGKKLPVTLCAGLTLVDNQSPLEDAAATAECHLYMAYHHAWHDPQKNWLVSDAIHVSRRSETIAMFLSDPAMAKVLQQVLERETFKIELFSSSGEFLSALARKSFNLLVTDDGFSGSEGFQLLELIQDQTSIKKRLRSIMIVEGDAGIERALKLGVHDYAIKPLSISRLRSQIMRLLFQREESRSQSRLTIMVVDHEIPQLLMAGTALHQLGECRVLLAHGPKDALRRLMHVQPHYLVLDMMMPGMAGEEFIKTIPDLDWLKSMEIIMATPVSETPVVSAEARKILGVVTRPYRPLKFIKEMRALIPLLQDATQTLPLPVDLAPLEAEVRRILSMQAAHL
jgi:two-component system cell cycle response regulator